MLDRWFPYVTFPVSMETFHQLPRNAAYKYEYWDGAAHLSARPKSYHCLLDLKRAELVEQVVIQGDRPARFRSLVDTDWPELPQLFASAFERMPPFGLIEREQRVAAAEECLEFTRTGGDGPMVPPASFVAYASGDERIVGAILITLMQRGNLEDFRDECWRARAPDDALQQRWGRPHLTWIFVSPWYARFGVGSALLSRAVNVLLDLGYRDLASTFLLGNESGMLWHWKSGFRLLGYPGSPGAIQRKVDAGGGEDGVES
jgi:GNAT superfamily N-acetyltransferase